MAEKLRILADLWPVFTSVAGLGIWAAVLGWRVKSLEVAKREHQDEISSMKADMKSLNSMLHKDLTEIRESLAWLKGKFSMLESDR